MSEIIMREEGELGMWDSALDVFAFGEEDGACLGGVGQSLVPIISKMVEEGK